MEHLMTGIVREIAHLAGGNQEDRSTRNFGHVQVWTPAACVPGECPSGTKRWINPKKMPGLGQFKKNKNQSLKLPGCPPDWSPCRPRPSSGWSAPSCWRYFSSPMPRSSCSWRLTRCRAPRPLWLSRYLRLSLSPVVRFEVVMRFGFESRGLFYMIRSYRIF